MNINHLLPDVKITSFTSKHNIFLKKMKNDEAVFSSKEASPPKKEPFFKRFKVVFASVISSLITGLSVFAVVNKVNNKKNFELVVDNNNLKNQNEHLKTSYEELQTQNNNLQSSIDKLKQSINSIVLPKDISASVEAKRKEISESSLSYSPTSPFDGGVRKMNTYRDSIPVDILPEFYQKTKNRSDAIELNYQKFDPKTPYYFEFPTSNEIKTVHEHVDNIPETERFTTISESYADSLAWDDDKIARDLLQNFYDGHGQTMDGIKLSVNPNKNGKHKVRIQGKSTFLPDKAIILGESSKKDDSKAAGNYGEGLKMVVLKLLREKGSDTVKIASDNWSVDWSLKAGDFGNRVLAYKLQEVAPVEGNYIEFETDNTKFINTLIGSFDRFYHYNNSDFKCPDFENDKISLKVLPDEKQTGKFYITGQAFEVGGEYDGLKGLSINIKNKPPHKYNGKLIFDPSRDRISLTDDNMEAIGSWIISKANMSKEEAVKIIHSLEKYWDVGSMMDFHKTKAKAFIKGIFKGAYERDDINIKFPEEKKCIADSFFGVSEGIRNMFANSGYRICNPYFDRMGMRSIKELAYDVRKHKPLVPSEVQKNKILILQQAIKLMEPVLRKDDFFTDDELKSNIYIFDKDSKTEDSSYKNVNGEAIVQNGKSYGFWLDKTYLDTTDFSSAFSTSLHELTHKFGGDESSTFSYKLTDVLQKVFESIQENPNLAIQLKVLEEAWNAQ